MQRRAKSRWMSTVNTLSSKALEGISVAPPPLFFMPSIHLQCLKCCVDSKIRRWIDPKEQARAAPAERSNLASKTFEKKQQKKRLFAIAFPHHPYCFWSGAAISRKSSFQSSSRVTSGSHKMYSFCCFLLWFKVPLGIQLLGNELLGVITTWSY